MIMEQYIDKAAVIAEIEREKAYAQTLGDNAINSSMQQFFDGMKEGCNCLLNSINALEMKDVDYRPIDKDFERDAVSFCIDNGLNTTPHIAKTIAKHFFELGLKAQK